MSKLILNPEYRLYERNGQVFCSSRQVAEEYRNALREMESAVHRSYLYPDQLNENLRLLELAEDLLPDKFEFPFLRHACQEKIMRNFMDTRISEKDVHEWFKKNVKTVLGSDYQIVKRKNDPRHIPDFWLKRSGSYVPVEIKLHGFDLKHLSQLQRYMDFYECAEGVAVAKELNCDLPGNVKFVKYETEGWGDE